MTVERQYKICVLGNSGVGKTPLVVQFDVGIFIDKYYEPTIEDNYSKQTEVDGQQYRLDIVDTGGFEGYKSTIDMYARDNQGFILVYSITDHRSFSDIEDLIDEIIKCSLKPVPMVIVGMKSDLESEREVDKELGEQLADRFSCSFYEASAKDDVNITEVFHSLIRLINQSKKSKKGKDKKD
ncbi:unnamed protein product, partial [Meganyctiphanes norvegica]